MTASNLFRLFRLSAVLGIASTAAWAQVSAPVLGLLPDRGRILPVNGIPASASIAPALDFGVEFLQIAIAPRQNFALVSAADTGAVLLAYPNGTTTVIDGVTAYPDAIWLSPLGSAAVLWFASPHLLEIVSGLPGSPVVRQVNASFLSGSSSSEATSDVPASLAVSDDGAWGAGAWPSGVWGFGPNGEVRSLLAGDRAFALAFFAGRQDLAAATRAGIYSVSDVGGSAAISTLYTAPDAQGPSGPAPAPSGLGISTDNQRLVMTDSGGGVVTLNLASGSSARMDCGCAPDGVFSMGGAIFRITGLTGSVFRIFDAAAGSVFLAPLAPDAGPPAGSPLRGPLTGNRPMGDKP
jgi:hypothetical protein